MVEMLIPSQTAIVLLGYQNDYFARGGALCGLVDKDGLSKKVMANTLSLLRNVRDNGVLVVSLPMEFSQFYDEIDVRCMAMQQIKSAHAFQRDSWGARVCNEIRGFRQYIHYLGGKVGFNGFIGTGLNNYLCERGIYNIVLAGAVTSVCIDSTARTATEKGFNTIVLDDCTCGRNREEQTFYMENICPLYSTVVKSTELFNIIDRADCIAVGS